MILCGTGHRPDKLGGYSEEVFDRLVYFAEGQLLMFPQVDLVISGMALGWDQALAEAALNLCIPVKAYIPFIGMESKWPKQSQGMYNRLLRNISEENWVICSEGSYAVWKMQKRNEDMVKASNLVLALWNGIAGGTANCVAYASKTGTEILNVWPEWDSEEQR